MTTIDRRCVRYNRDSMKLITQLHLTCCNGSSGAYCWYWLLLLLDAWRVATLCEPLGRTVIAYLQVFLQHVLFYFIHVTHVTVVCTHAPMDLPRCSLAINATYYSPSSTSKFERKRWELFRASNKFIYYAKQHCWIFFTEERNLWKKISKIILYFEKIYSSNFKRTNRMYRRCKNMHMRNPK